MKLEELYTKKQIEVFQFMKNNDIFILVQHGAKRAGKTVANNDLFLQELVRVKANAKKCGVDKPQYILAGNSLGNVQRNVLIELENRYGLKFHMDKYNRFELLGVQVCCFGHGTIRDISRIRGMTSFGAYINEGSTAVNEVFKEIINRCSGDGARIIVDTNPDNPLHWLKTDYIDKADNKTIAEFAYTLFDNDFLTKRYIDNIVASTPSGVFTDRDIYGRWVSAEGIVYKDFNIKRHMIEKLDSDEGIVKYVGGVDWGYEHHGTMVVIAKTTKDRYFLIEEIAEKHKYVDWWLDRAKELQEKYIGIRFYCDSARTEHITYLAENGIRAYMANKAVIEGIDFVGTLLKTDRLVFDKTKFIKGAKEMFLYVWDKNKNGGKDDVVKSNDDVLDSVRYALFSDFKQKTIKSFDINDIF